VDSDDGRGLARPVRPRSNEQKRDVQKKEGPSPVDAGRVVPMEEHSPVLDCR